MFTECLILNCKKNIKNIWLIKLNAIYLQRVNNDDKPKTSKRAGTTYSPSINQQY